MATSELLNDPLRRPERVVVQVPEYGDCRDVQRTFGIRETFCYQLWRDRKITGLLIPGSGGKRGKRLFNFDSIRKYLAECEAKPVRRRSRGKQEVAQ
jgi:hypothetical protein